MTASVAMTNYFHSLRQHQDFGSLEIVMDNPRTSAPEIVQADTSPKMTKAEKRWSQQLVDLSLSSTAAPITGTKAPFIPQRRLSMDCDSDNETPPPSPPSSCQRRRRRRTPTPKTCRRKRRSKTMAE